MAKHYLIKKNLLILNATIEFVLSTEGLLFSQFSLQSFSHSRDSLKCFILFEQHDYIIEFFTRFNFQSVLPHT